MMVDRVLMFQYLIIGVPEKIRVEHQLSPPQAGSQFQIVRRQQAALVRFHQVGLRSCTNGLKFFLKV